MNDKQIKLVGLTPEEVQMLDMMWSIESFDDYQDWLDNLTRTEARTAQSLHDRLLLELLDQEITEDLTLAKDVLKKFML
jgi:hypothetical protein